MRWDDASSRWIVETNRGDALRARFVCMANGPPHWPKLPGILGIETFKGHTFHPSRWDYEYTGGTNEGGLTKLADERVAIIGTGSTAGQCVPHVGAAAAQLYVFRRTPSSIDVRGHRPTDPEWAASLEPGWQKRRMDNFNNLVSGGFEAEDLVNDGWTDIIRKLLVIMQTESNDEVTPESVERTMELADFEKMEQIRARVEALVEDPETAEALKPYYRQFCKRPCFYDDYLQTFNRPNVTLVDTAGRGVERITEWGVVAGGVEYRVDCIIYATGFEVGTDYTRRSGYDLVGRGGITLSEKWKDGARTFHGMHMRGFPNCFVISNTQSGFSVSFPHMLDEQSKHLAYIIGHAMDHDIKVVEASQVAEDAWVQAIIDLAVNRQEFLESCTPGYYNNEGQPADRSGQNGFYGGGSIVFIRLIEEWRAAGTLEGLELTK